VLFSKETVAQFINANFEPVWESVRPVPMVHIDFGNGTVLTRTLHGNILTSVCDAEGNVLDGLPGIYAEKEYLHQLYQLHLLARYIRNHPAAKRAQTLCAYHQRQAEALKNNQRPEEFAMNRKAEPITKRAIERPVEIILAAAEPIADEPKETPNLPAREDVASWKELAEDTRLNETTRRCQIHDLLADAGMVQPAKVTRPIYKDVLHADLDDPYLGLGKALFETYPFGREEARR
jgi:hypothetical protein